MDERFEILVVGAGPCGIAVGAAAAKAGMSCALVDKGCITASLVDYPYYMTFFSTARMLEIGDVPFTIPRDKPTRRDALAYYRFVVRHWGIDVRQYEEVTEISGREGDFTVRTRKRDGIEGTYRADAVVVATGGFQEPNDLDVPGEELPKVLHYYKEPYPFYDQDVLVVGGSNSAVEAALETYRNGARVTMVHFLDSIDKGVKPWVVPDITNRLKNREIEVYFKHRVAEVKPSSVVLRAEGSDATVEIDNDFVLAMTGWRADPWMLRDLGVRIDEESGIPTHDPATMATDVPGVYIAGVIAAGHNANKIFIENGREHGELIVAHRASRSGA
ncbi:MAG: YpdA family putative bacillithiol disulfide reductase [Gemmatimonadota bacterium]|jgi:thioredoxin reductase (NADPH)